MLTDSLNEVSETNSNCRDEQGLNLPNDIMWLHKAGMAFASQACDTYGGELLSAALKVSEAIANFTDAFQRGK